MRGLVAFFAVASFLLILPGASQADIAGCRSLKQQAASKLFRFDTVAFLKNERQPNNTKLGRSLLKSRRDFEKIFTQKGNIQKGPCDGDPTAVRATIKATVKSVATELGLSIPACTCSAVCKDDSIAANADPADDYMACADTASDFCGAGQVRSIICP